MIQRAKKEVFGHFLGFGRLVWKSKSQELKKFESQEGDKLDSLKSQEVEKSKRWKVEKSKALLTLSHLPRGKATVLNVSWGQAPNC